MTERGCLKVFTNPPREVGSPLSGRLITLLPPRRGARYSVLALRVLVPRGDLRANAVFLGLAVQKRGVGEEANNNKTILRNRTTNFQSKLPEIYSGRQQCDLNRSLCINQLRRR